MRRIVIALCILALLLSLGYSVAYASVVDFAQDTGYRPATAWEVNNIPHECKRLIWHGVHFPWLFREIGEYEG